jgi:hypothetical protein
VSNGKSGGVFGFALIFLLLFLSRKKVNKERSRKRKYNKDSLPTKKRTCIQIGRKK